MKKSLIVILSLLLIAALFFVLPRDYKDGTEELSPDGASGEIHKGYSQFERYLHYEKDLISSYILSCENIVVGVAKGKPSDLWRTFEITEVIKGKLSIGEAGVFNDPSQMGIFFRDDNEYVLFLDSFMNPIPYAVFNTTEKTSHSATKVGAVLYKDLPRNSKRLINTIKNHPSLSRVQALTNMSLSDRYPPEVILERSDFQCECVVEDVFLLEKYGEGENFYRIYARGVTGELKDKVVVFDQGIDDATAKSLKGESFTGYFEPYPYESNKVVGFLDVGKVVK